VSTGIQLQLKGWFGKNDESEAEATLNLGADEKRMYAVRKA